MLYKPERYRLSFTFGGLLIPETRTVAEAYRTTPDWEVVRTQMVEKNGLQKTRSSSAFRYFREIRERLSNAYPWELDAIAGSPGGQSPHPTESDIPTVIFAVFSRYYQLVGDFTSQLVRQRMLSGLNTVDEAAFRAFMADQIPAHPELASIADSTADKLVSVAMRAFREAGIISGKRPPYTVTPPPLTAALRRRYCANKTPEDLVRLLWTDEEIQPCLT